MTQSEDAASPVSSGESPTVSAATPDPRRYFESRERHGGTAQAPPVCLYLETTNRCNLLCTTCPRTYEELGPPADLSWELFRRIEIGRAHV